jgi:hypothetical protein
MNQFNPIVTIPRQIIFREPLRKHPGKGSKTETVFKVATDLEEGYSIAHIFYRMYKDELKSIIIQEVKRAWKSGRDQEATNQVIAERIKNLWRQFIIREEHGIKTKAALREGRQSFVDTGAYYKGMAIKVK